MNEFRCSSLLLDGKIPKNRHMRKSAMRNLQSAIDWQMRQYSDQSEEFEKQIESA